VAYGPKTLAVDFTPGLIAIDSLFCQFLFFFQLLFFSSFLADGKFLLLVFYSRQFKDSTIRVDKMVTKDIVVV
jgi:hypothetical protein